MKTCPLCGAAAADTATTCFECLYSFAAMSARTSTLAEVGPTGVISPHNLGPEAPSREAIEHAPGQSHLTLLRSDGTGRRALVRSHRGALFVGSTTGSRPRRPQLSVHRTAEGEIIAERLSANLHASLNGGALGESWSMLPGDRIEMGTLSMTLVTGGGAKGGGRLLGAGHRHGC